MNLYREGPRNPTGFAVYQLRETEVLTTGAITYVFGCPGNNAQIRRVIKQGKVKCELRLGTRLAGKDLYLVDLESAIDYWGSKRQIIWPSIDDRLESMRSHAVTLVFDERAYRILHPTPLVSQEEVPWA